MKTLKSVADQLGDLVLALRKARAGKPECKGLHSGVRRFSRGGSEDRARRRRTPRRGNICRRRWADRGTGGTTGGLPSRPASVACEQRHKSETCQDTRPHGQQQRQQNTTARHVNMLTTATHTQHHARSTTTTHTPDNTQEAHHAHTTTHKQDTREAKRIRVRERESTPTVAAQAVTPPGVQQAVVPPEQQQVTAVPAPVQALVTVPQTPQVLGLHDSAAMRKDTNIKIWMLAILKLV